MKTLILLMLTMCFQISGISQNAFLIEKEIPTQEVSVNALIINVTDDFDEVIDNYKKFVKDNYDLKVKKENRSTYEVEAVDLPHLSEKRGDLRTYLTPTDSMNLLAFSFVLGYDIFLNSQDYPDEMAEFRRFVVAFMEFHYEEYFSDRIDVINKELSDDKKTLLKNQKRIHSLSKKTYAIDKKVSKEEDISKKEKMKSDKLNLENEKSELTILLPAIREKIMASEHELSQLREEQTAYHRLITSL